MECDVCGTEMVLGKALPGPRENALHIATPARLNADTIELIDVLKCPECGRSLDELDLRERGINLASLLEK